MKHDDTSKKRRYLWKNDVICNEKWLFLWGKGEMQSDLRKCNDATLRSEWRTKTLRKAQAEETTLVTWHSTKDEATTKDDQPQGSNKDSSKYLPKKRCFNCRGKNCESRYCNYRDKGALCFQCSLFGPITTQCTGRKDESSKTSPEKHWYVKMVQYQKGGPIIKYKDVHINGH